VIIMPLSRYLKIYPCPDRPGSLLLYSTRKGSVVRVSETLLAAVREETLTAAERERLSELEMIVEDPVAELEAMRSLVRRANARSTRFTARVVLNLDCNLDCGYCFEDRFRGHKYMSQETAALLVEYVIREHMEQGRDVELNFYGGEPLLSVPLLREVALPIREAARVRGTRFSFSLTSNATLLTRPLVEELLPLGLVRANLTLDGPREVHDRQRPFVSGKGSFDLIVANIKEVVNLIDIQLGGNFSKKNWREFPRLLDHLVAEGITPEKFGIVQFTPIAPKAGKSSGPETSAVCCSSAEPWLMEAGPILREEILRRGFEADRPTTAACMIEFENDLVVNYDGTLYKCPVFMGWPELSVGSLAAGVKDYGDSHNLAVWQNNECLACAYLPLCFGGCRFLTLQATGAIDGVDCRKAFYDATLETMVRQDLRYRPASQ
jgi:uncharacterized protein